MKMIHATDPATFARELCVWSEGTQHQLHGKLHNRYRTDDTIYWLLPRPAPVAHALAKGMVMPSAGDTLWIGFYLEKGVDPSLVPDARPFEYLSKEWAWHDVVARPSEANKALLEMRKHDPVELFVRSPTGSVTFNVAEDGRLAVREEHANGSPGVMAALAGASLAGVLLAIERTPEARRDYVDVVAAHAYARGRDTGFTAAQHVRRSIKPWEEFIWNRTLGAS